MNDRCFRTDGPVENLQQGQAGEVQVLRGVDLKVRAGEVVALVAPSGAGKSTLLHMAGLLDTPDEGEVVFAGQRVNGLSDRKRTALRREDVGFVYQFHHLLPEFNALENVVLPQLAAGTPRAEADSRALDLLGRVGVAPRAQHRPAALSGGEAQRVAFCRALANKPSFCWGTSQPATWIRPLRIRCLARLWTWCVALVWRPLSPRIIWNWPRGWTVLCALMRGNCAPAIKAAIFFVSNYATLCFRYGHRRATVCVLTLIDS